MMMQSERTLVAGKGINWYVFSEQQVGDSNILNIYIFEPSYFTSRN